MLKATIIINWAMVVLLLATFVWLYAVNRYVGIWPITLALIPYVSTLAALHKSTRKAGKYAVLVLCAFLGVLYLFSFVIEAFKSSSHTPLLNQIAIIVLIAPIFLNIYTLFVQARLQKSQS